MTSLPLSCRLSPPQCSPRTVLYVCVYRSGDESRWAEGQRDRGTEGASGAVISPGIHRNSGAMYAVGSCYKRCCASTQFISPPSLGRCMLRGACRIQRPPSILSRSRLRCILLALLPIPRRLEDHAITSCAGLRGRQGSLDILPSKVVFFPRSARCATPGSGLEGFRAAWAR